MQTRHKIGILGATGVIGQRFIQLLENHPWFEITWLAASDKSSGKTYGEAVRWKLDTPLPSRIAAMMVSPAGPEGAPGVIFAALDTDIARELEPKFAAAGCAVILTANHPALKPLGTTLLWLVVISAIASAAHYFHMFWSQINFRVQQRRRAVLLVNQEEKPQDILTR